MRRTNGLGNKESYMTRYRVDCIVPDGADRDRRIDRLGGFSPYKWSMPIDEVIQRINRGSDQFYVIRFGRQVNCVVRRHGVYGPFFVTTEADGFPPNNLLNLDRCYH